MRNVLQIGSLIAFILLTGCAAIPSEVNLMVNTTPAGATVVSSDGWTCTTPCSHQVVRDSEFDLEVTQSGYKPASESVEIPAFKRSNLYRNVGASLGFIVMLLGADISSDLGSALIDALTGEDASVLSTGEKIGSGLIGGVVFGGVGYAIDRMRDQNRAARPIPVEIQLEQAAAASD